VSAGSVFADRELVELLAEKPDLLAIADAISSVGVPPRRRRLPLRVPLLAAAIVGAALVALLSPWSESRGGVLSKALAAVSTDAVLHTVVVESIPGQEIIDLKTSRSAPDTIRIEGWFDFQRSLKRTVTLRDGVRSDVLATPQGVFSSAGVVPTCSWIAAHPVEATKLRVSCNPSGRNGTTPRHIPESIPAPDPALAGFITGYRQALQRGQATNLGGGTIDGHHVFWIGFNVDANQRERVAVDASTYTPLVHETVIRGKVAIRAQVVTAEKIDYSAAVFARPTLSNDQPAVVGNVVATAHVQLETAEQALGGRARSLGSHFAGLRLTDARIDSLRTGYGPLSHKPVEKSRGVQFIYGSGSPRAGTGPYLRVSEATSPQMAYFGQTPHGLTSGHLSLTVFPSNALFVGQLHAHGLYITIEGSNRLTVVAAARTLAGIS